MVDPAAEDRRLRFEAVVAATYAPLRRYLGRRTDPASADDVLGDVLLVMWRRADDIPADAVLPWCYGVARGCLVDSVRARQRQLRLVRRLSSDRSWQPPEVAAEDPRLRDAMNGLPAKDLEVLRLWAWEDLAPREIALALGISANAASIRLHRAPKRPKARLAADTGKDPARPGQEGIEPRTEAPQNGGPPMTGDDDLRARLARIDPMRSGAADLPASLTAAELKERAMQTIETDRNSPQPDEHSAPWRRPRLLAAAAAVVLVLGAGTVVATSGDDPAPKANKPTTLALAMPNSSAASSCAMFDVAILRAMPVAFAGTVTDISADTVTLDVDRWHKGGSAGQVAVSLGSGQNSAALDGVDFVEGTSYLVAAADGRVSGCGLSGPVSPELQSAYDQAFSG